MDAAADVLIGIVVAVALAGVALRSPALRSGVELLVLTGWFAFSVLLPVAFVPVHLARGAFGLALLCAVIAIFFWFPWRALGWPALRRAWQLRSFKLWV